MAYIDKLLNKFNKIQNSINSLKGISAKIQSLNYNTEIDKLKENKTKALADLKSRNDALDSLNIRSGMTTAYMQEDPSGTRTELSYPYHDTLANYIVFDIRDRKIGNKKDLANTIALYIPDELISSSSVSYGQTDISPIAKAISGVIDSFSEDTGNVGDAFTSGGQAVAGVFKNKIENFITGGIKNVRKGIAINPQKEALLQPLEFRTFSFNYEFNPRSEEEARRVREIIHTFRMAMLPDGLTATELGFNVNVEEQDPELKRQSNEIFFSFPNVFDIYFDGPIGDKVDGFLPAVCTNAEVNYTGGQKFATHYDGQPVKVDLALSFQEIRVMTRGNYEQIASYTHDFKGQNIISNENDNDSIVDKVNPRG